MAIRKRRASELDDGRLVRRCKRGDRVALAELLDRHRGLICTVARRVAGKGEHLDDLIQDALVAVVEGMDRFRGDSKLSTWVAAVTTRTAVKWVDRNGCARAAPLDENTPVAEKADDTAARLVEAIDRLPSDQRAVVTLRHIEGLSTEDVAEALGVPVGTVKSRLHYARQQLKRVMLARPEEASNHER